MTRFADRVDQVLTQTIYPAVCAVRDQKDLLFEAFTKSNRLALMWGIPFGAGLALFAPDLVEFVLGEKWDIAIGLIQVLGVVAGVQQLAFNWTAFLRALDNTRPLALSGVLSATIFLAAGVPLTLSYGLRGYAVAFILMTAVELALRTYFLSQIFSGFAMLSHSLRAVAPTVPAVARRPGRSGRWHSRRARWHRRSPSWGSTRWSPPPRRGSPSERCCASSPGYLRPSVPQLS